MSIGRTASLVSTLSGAGIILLIVALLAALHRSLPLLDEELIVDGIENPIVIIRDDHGTPQIISSSLNDAVTAQGFVHAQDRYFQMDLYRRVASGRLSELFGSSTLEMDIETRRHRFMQVAQGVLDRMPPSQLTLVKSYSDGVNAGLAALHARPPEYLLIGMEPGGWTPRDTILVSLFMQLALSRESDFELELTSMLSVLPPELVDFLTPYTTRFDVMPDGTPGDYTPGTIPSLPLEDSNHAPIDMRFIEQPSRGSNCFAIAGWRSRHGGAIIANDMHLGLSVPNSWYRIQLGWTDPDGTDRLACGISLPGAPGMVVGSNCAIAWGFTNATGDFIDHVIIESSEDLPNKYRTPDGLTEFGEHRESFNVRGQPDVTHSWKSTVWGLVSAQDHLGRDLVEVWTAHSPDRCNLNILDMLRCTTIEDGLDVAREWWGPPQNVLLASSDGRIAWILAGWIPERRGFDGSVPVSWAEHSVGWSGPINEADRPTIIDPESGFLATANARTLPYPESKTVGRNYALAVRQQRIAELLSSRSQVDEEALLAIALDTHSPTHDHYRDILLRLMARQTEPSLPLPAIELRDWDGCATAGSAVYLLIDRFRDEIHHLVFEEVINRINIVHPGFKYRWNAGEEVVLRLLEEQPTHWLGEQYESWNDLLFAALERALIALEYNEPSRPPSTTWGQANRLKMQHPLSRFTGGALGGFDMPYAQQSGDKHCVRVAAPSFGASQRLVVSPGREEKGIFHSPGGISGHPLSPYYSAGHNDWLEGAASPLLVQPPRHELTLMPASRP